MTKDDHLIVYSNFDINLTYIILIFSSFCSYILFFPVLLYQPILILPYFFILPVYYWVARIYSNQQIKGPPQSK